MIRTSETSNQIEKLNKDDPMEKNRTMCRLLNIQLREFYDDIYIPYNFFKNGDWNISKILYDNEDSLFYNKKYLTEEDEKRFHDVFSKYIVLIEEIFNPDNSLYICLNNWTDANEEKWRNIEHKTYLKSILTKSKYQIISPSHTVNLYRYYSRQFLADRKKCNEKFEEHLNSIIINFKKEYKLFCTQYNEIVDLYVCEHPLYNDSNYVLGFINSVILLIIDFSEKLINLNIYAIHPIIVEIIEYYTPLDEINSYRSSENNGKKLYII